MTGRMLLCDGYGDYVVQLYSGASKIDCSHHRLAQPLRTPPRMMGLIQ
jgi:hypothetical protein